MIGFMKKNFKNAQKKKNKMHLWCMFLIRCIFFPAFHGDRTSARNLSWKKLLMPWRASSP
jgi:hypothetical protein